MGHKNFLKSKKLIQNHYFKHILQNILILCIVKDLFSCLGWAPITLFLSQCILSSKCKDLVQVHKFLKTQKTTILYMLVNIVWSVVDCWNYDWNVHKIFHNYKPTSQPFASISLSMIRSMLIWAVCTMLAITWKQLPIKNNWLWRNVKRTYSIREGNGICERTFSMWMQWKIGEF